MKKIMFCIITGILLLNSIIATGIMADNISKDDSSTIISGGQEEEWIPTVFECHLEMEESGRFDCTLIGNDIEINNWTQKEQKVRVKWSFDSDCTDEKNVVLHVRYREWTAPLAVLVFFLFSRYGKIDTPNHPRSIPITINVTKGKYQHYEDINITIEEEEDYQELAGFAWMVNSKMNGFINFQWCGADINIEP